MTRKLLAVVLLLSSVSCFSGDIKSEIIDRCRTQMNQYGSTMVKACVDQDIEAVAVLSKMIEERKYSAIINRCMGQMQSYGYNMVKACVDQDIEAEKALKNY